MTGRIEREQRVGVFVDVQNLYYSAKNLYTSKVNYSEILKAAVGARTLVRAFAYVIKADVDTEASFFEALYNMGFEVRVKELQVFYGGAKKGDWDIGIAMDMIRLAPKLDVEILVSGDGDFRSLLEYLRSQGCRTEVVSFGKSSSQKLLEESDGVIDLDKDLKRFLLKPMERRPHKEDSHKPHKEDPPSEEEKKE